MKRHWLFAAGSAVLAAILLASCGGGGGGGGGRNPPAAPGKPGSGGVAECLRLSAAGRPLSADEIQRTEQFAAAALQCKPTEAEMLQFVAALRN